MSPLDTLLVPSALELVMLPSQLGTHHCSVFTSLVMYHVKFGYAHVFLVRQQFAAAPQNIADTGIGAAQVQLAPPLFPFQPVAPVVTQPAMVARHPIQALSSPQFGAGRRSTADARPLPLPAQHTQFLQPAPRMPPAMPAQAWLQPPLGFQLGSLSRSASAAPASAARLAAPVLHTFPLPQAAAQVPLGSVPRNNLISRCSTPPLSTATLALIREGSRVQDGAAYRQQVAHENSGRHVEGVTPVADPKLFLAHAAYWRASLAESTLNTYAVGIRRYQRFCAQVQLATVGTVG